MAEPLEPNETFLREVDENLRRDRVRDFWKKYGLWVGVAVGIFLIASGGYLWWQDHKLQQSEEQVERFAEVLKTSEAARAAHPSSGSTICPRMAARPSAPPLCFTRAAMAIEDNDFKLAAAKYGEIAGDSSLPKPFRDPALIRQTALQFDGFSRPGHRPALAARQAGRAMVWYCGRDDGPRADQAGSEGPGWQAVLTIAKDNSVPPGFAAVPSSSPVALAWTRAAFSPGRANRIDDDQE